MTEDICINADATTLRRRFRRENYTWQALTRRKPLADSLEEEKGTVRHLRWWDLTAFGIATTIGSGVYVTCGLVARDVTGPAVVLSTLIAGMISVLTSVCYLEFASSLPISGSGYAYFYVLVGEFLAWFIGWNLTLEYAFSAAAIAGGWTSYLVTLMEAVGLPLPSVLYDIPMTGIFRINLLSPLVVVAIGALVARGLRFGALVTNGITIFNLVLIGFIVVVGGWHVSAENWRPFMPMGPGAVFHGAGEMFFSYLGFDAVTTLAADAVHPARDIPLATVLTISTATVLYMSVGLVLTGMQRYTQLDKANPLALAFTAVGCQWAYYVVTVCALTTMTLTIFTCIVGQPKIFCAMARDGLLPAPLARINRSHVPMTGVVVTIALTALLALTLDVRTGLIDMISFGCLFCMSAICAATLSNRFTRLEGESLPAAVRRNGLLATICFFFGSLLTATIWNQRVGGPLLQMVLTITSFVVTVLAPFAMLTFLFVRHGGLLSAPRMLPPIATGQLTGGESSEPRPAFSCPAMPFLPCTAILANAVVMMKTNVADIGLFAIWAALGIVVYLLHGIHHSRLVGRENDTSMIKTHEDSSSDRLLPEADHKGRAEAHIPLL